MRELGIPRRPTISISFSVRASLERRAAPIIRAFRARADALVARCPHKNARLVARRLLHAPTLKLRGDPADADAVVEDALRRVEVALDELPP